MSKIFASVSCNLDSNILLASLPLFEAEMVDAIEWSFDALFKTKEIPEWFLELLQTFSNANRLIGHGVYFSLFSGRFTKEQKKWLAQLERLSKQFRFDHITEHFGFMSGENFHTGAPLSIPYSKKILTIGQDRLKRISNVCNCPIGLENLAFAFTAKDVEKHGDFLMKLLAPVNGFIILDLHNVYCQAHNFNVEPEKLIGLYPLELVREIHISGGSWQDSQIIPGKKIRRDTHDDSVPEQVFQLLEYSIDKCFNIKYIVMEQLGHALDTNEKREYFKNDFIKLLEIVQKAQNNTLQNKINEFLPLKTFSNVLPLEDEELYKQQCTLSYILESADSYKSAVEMLKNFGFSDTSWKIEEWQPYMLETAIAVAQKWKNGFA